MGIKIYMAIMKQYQPFLHQNLLGIHSLAAVKQLHTEFPMTGKRTQSSLLNAAFQVLCGAGAFLREKRGLAQQTPMDGKSSLYNFFFFLTWEDN